EAQGWDVDQRVVPGRAGERGSPTTTAIATIEEATMALPILQIRLLGEFSLIYGGAPVPAVNTARLRPLLAYLLVHRDASQPRHHLAYLFWPDATEEQARNNLRQMLHQLRHALPDADRFLYADANSLCWRADASFSLDVADFERLLLQAEAAEYRPDRGVQRTPPVEAVDLYRADLPPSCYADSTLPARPPPPPPPPPAPPPPAPPPPAHPPSPPPPPPPPPPP